MFSADAAPTTLLRQVRLVRAQGPTDELYDLTLQQGRISAIHPSGTGQQGASAAKGPVAVPDQVLDGHGLLAMPGFIDAHTHAEAAIFDPEVQQALLAQGVTTIITGQDGVSFAPSHGPEGRNKYDAAKWAGGYFAAINGEVHPHFSSGTVGDLLATYARVPLRVEYLVPHGTLRYAVRGDRPGAASDQEVAAMCELLRQGLAQGAVGMSTGLEYQPGGQADDTELTALSRVLAAQNRVHVSHMRGYEEKAEQGFRELRRIAQASGVATHISHYHGPAEELAGLIDQANAQGLDFTFDSYPYLRGCSILSMVTLPTWLPLADQDRCIALLQDPQVVQRLEQEHFGQLDDLWPRITLAAVPGEHQWTEGRTLVEVATGWELSPAQAALRLLISTRLRASCVFAQPPTNSFDSMRQLLRHPKQMVGSDAIYQGGMPHPRGWGSFARLLGLHVRELGDWDLAQAQHHLSTAAAARFGLHGRGVIEVGASADVVVLDSDLVADQATYTQPRNLASGIQHVVVNGHTVLKDGRRLK